MRFGLRFVLFCLMVVIITAPAGYAQASAINGEVTGTVTDPSGAAISGATVTITSGATGFKQSTKTAESGLYRFSLLPLGTYDIEVTASGFADTRHTGIVVNAGAIKSEDVQMQLSATSTRIEVAATAVITDPSRVDLGSTLTYNTIANLPLVSRNPYNFILFQPNVSGRANTEFGVPRKLNANGFNGRINYQIDGNNNTESDRAGIRLVLSPILISKRCSRSSTGSRRNSAIPWERFSIPSLARGPTIFTARPAISFAGRRSARVPSSSPPPPRRRK
jgi:hypothetical protein